MDTIDPAMWVSLEPKPFLELNDPILSPQRGHTLLFAVFFPKKILVAYHIYLKLELNSPFFAYHMEIPIGVLALIFTEFSSVAKQPIWNRNILNPSINLA